MSCFSSSAWFCAELLGARIRVSSPVFLRLLLAASMEEITEKVNNLSVNSDIHKKNRIQVSNTKKPLFFYVNLAKEELIGPFGGPRYMQQHDEVELSALGMAISTVVTITEILKNNGLAVEKSKISLTKPVDIPLIDATRIILFHQQFFFPEIATSLVEVKDDTRVRPLQKAKIEILLGKTANFDELMAAATNERDGGEDQ
ncbi:hypothetical protein ZIOFF_045145 [Zingiber officinale]|uniref:DNA/RNA-binding protein Alba-like domain-containing protein n=1 Tax=Zingiber officinale TaxID=94328 RepID=A0A8J5G0F9_ZINOF|nr:hypothetical protein ZIOFF_045145 [Zingiber officinale]